MSRKAPTMHELTLKALAEKCRVEHGCKTPHLCRCSEVKHNGPHRCALCGDRWFR